MANMHLNNVNSQISVIVVDAIIACGEQLLQALSPTPSILLYDSLLWELVTSQHG